jgi:ATP-binding protein involved in chromosome partitioning
MSVAPPTTGTPSEADVIAALREVHEPELHRSIVELDMVRSVTISANNHIEVVVATKVEDDEMAEELAMAVEKRLAALPGVGQVRCALDVLSLDEQRVLLARLREGWGTHENAGQNGHGHSTGPADAPPFMQIGAKTRILGISSGKGGVGKSSTTVNLAISLVQQGYSVGVLDADIYGFSVPKMLGVDRQPTMIPDANAEDKEMRMIIPPVGHGVSAMSMGFLVEEDRAIIWRGPMIHKALEQFLTDVYWGEPDFLLVDMPPGTGDVALSMAQYLPRAELFVVTTPQPAAQRVAQRSATMARQPQINMSVAGVIENMSWFTGDDGKRYEIFGSGGGQLLAETLGVPLIGQIPLVPDLREGMDIGLPITVSAPDSEASQAYAAIARTIAQDLAPKRRYNKALRIG